MKGYQLTFFTEQGRRHGSLPIGQWLLQFARAHGALAGTLVGAGEGFDHAGRFHSAGFIELADQPLAITVSVDEAGCERLMTALAREDVDLSFVEGPVEYGRVGAAAR